MSDIYYIIIIGLIVLGCVLAYLLSKRKSGAGDSAILMLQNQLNDIRQMLDSKISHSADMMQRQSHESSRIMGDLVAKLARLEKDSEQIKGFAGQLQSLDRKSVV